jgi:hypothetical protein
MAANVALTGRDTGIFRGRQQHDLTVDSIAAWC